MIELDKYQHLQTTEDDNNWRWYGTPDKPFSYVGNTTILGNVVKDPALESYYKHTTAAAIKSTLEEAGDFGTKAHEIFEHVVSDKEGGIRIPQTHLEHVGIFRRWMSENTVELIKQEFPVASEKYGFAGRVDFFGRVNGQVMLVDWKTGNNWGQYWRAQIAGYHLAICEMLGLDRLNSDIKMGVLHIPRSNPKKALTKEDKVKFNVIEHTDWVHEEFLAYLRCFKNAPNFYKLDRMGWKWLHEPVFKIL